MTAALLSLWGEVALTLLLCTLAIYVAVRGVSRLMLQEVYRPLLELRSASFALVIFTGSERFTNNLLLRYLRSGRLWHWHLVDAFIFVPALSYYLFPFSHYGWLYTVRLLSVTVFFSMALNGVEVALEHGDNARALGTHSLLVANTLAGCYWACVFVYAVINHDDNNGLLVVAFVSSAFSLVAVKSIDQFLTLVESLTLANFTLMMGRDACLNWEHTRLRATLHFFNHMASCLYFVTLLLQLVKRVIEDALWLVVEANGLHMPIWLFDVQIIIALMALAVQHARNTTSSCCKKRFFTLERLAATERACHRATADDLRRVAGDVCSVCLEQLHFGALVLPGCEHVFHERCLLRLPLVGHNSVAIKCPTCRTVVVLFPAVEQADAAPEMNDQPQAEQQVVAGNDDDFQQGGVDNDGHLRRRRSGFIGGLRRLLAHLIDD